MALLIQRKNNDAKFSSFFMIILGHWAYIKVLNWTMTYKKKYMLFIKDMNVLFFTENYERMSLEIGELVNISTHLFSSVKLNYKINFSLIVLCKNIKV